MRLINKKGDAATNETMYVVLAVVLLAVGLSIFFVLKTNFLNDASFRETVCYFSNNMKSGGGVFASFPHLCTLEIIPEGEEMGKEEFASLLRRSWWMYLQGAEDLGNVGDEVFPVYQFIPTEDILLKDYFEYSLTNTRGVPQKDISKSDYAYLETNGKDNALCFEASSDDDSISNYYLKKGNTYYIMFYDNQMPHDEDWGDKLLISSDPDFDARNWASKIILGTSYLIGASGGIPGIFVFVGGAQLVMDLADVQEGTCLTYKLYGNPEVEE